ERAHNEIFGTNDVPNFAGFAMNKLSTELDGHRQAPVSPRVDPATEPVACLEYRYVHASLSKMPRSGQAGHTCANDEHGLHWSSSKVSGPVVAKDCSIIFLILELPGRSQ